MNKTLHYSLAAAATLWLAGCVVAPPPGRPAPPPPPPEPHVAALHRAEQVEQRIARESQRIDAHVSQGYYPPPRGYQLHQNLDNIHQQARDMEAQFGGGLTGEEQRVLNDQLDHTSRAIGP